MTAAMRADGQWGEERDDKWCRATVTTLLGRKDENIPWEETEEKGVYALKAGAAAGAVGAAYDSSTMRGRARRRPSRAARPRAEEAGGADCFAAGAAARGGCGR